MTLSIQELTAAVENDTAFITVSTLMPAGGPQDRVAPPTFPKHPKREGPYLMENHRKPDGQISKAVVLDTVGSQANWLESGLQEVLLRHDLPLPCPTLDFSNAAEPIVALLGKLSALDLSHRIADSNFRYARLVEGGQKVEFFGSNHNRQLLLAAAQRDYSPIFGECPHALLFGFWDSKGPLGNKGPKVPRSITSEIMGWDAVEGVVGGIRRDPVGLAKVGTLAHTEEGLVQLDAAKGKERKEKKEKATQTAKDEGKRAPNTKSGDPSNFLLGNAIFPVKSDTQIKGGFTISSATQTVVLSLVGLRALSFKTDKSGKVLDPKTRLGVEKAARVYLAALGLLSLVAARQRGYNLRSRCLLLPSGPMIIEQRSSENEVVRSFSLTVDQAVALYQKAVEGVKKVGLPWNEQGLALEPTPKMLEMIKASFEKAEDEDSE